jgi:hypothetical protein
MAEHKIGTREEWQAARDELATLEAEQAERNEEIKRMRLALPWVPVEKEYEFDTKEGSKTLAELFEGRSQLLAYNIMFGPDYKLGACPGCTSLADELDGALVHMNHRDVTLICFSRAPIERLVAYKEQRRSPPSPAAGARTSTRTEPGLKLARGTQSSTRSPGWRAVPRRCGGHAFVSQVGRGGRSAYPPEWASGSHCVQSLQPSFAWPGAPFHSLGGRKILLPRHRAEPDVFTLVLGAQRRTDVRFAHRRGARFLHLG